MLQLVKKYTGEFKTPVYASLSLAFASLGDAFLYPFLPQYSMALDIPFIWIGFLLSINRFVRIFSNQWMNNLFAKYGTRRVIICAAILSIISTIGYGLGWGLISLIIFRVIWGFAFSALRIGGISYAFENKKMGLSLGVSRSIHEFGPVFALWIGPLLVANFNASNSFFLLGLMSIPAAFCAWKLPEIKHDAIIESSSFRRVPSILNSLTFASAYIVEGMLIVSIGYFISKDYYFSVIEVLSIAARYLAFRRICFIVLSPLSGMLADRLGFRQVFLFSMASISFGLCLITLGWEVPGLLLIFIFNSMNSSITPGSLLFTDSNKIKTIAENATWRDIGAALGTLTGGLILSSSFIQEVFIISTLILVILMIVFLTRSK
jgi:MFS transporter, DHA1 family, multidrug resistance protein